MSTKRPCLISKPLPSQEEQEKQENSKPTVKDVFQRVLEEAKKVKQENKDLSWSEDEESFEQQIEKSRQESLQEWAELRKPDEWDVALDQGKQKKIRKNKVSKRPPRKYNPFQEAATKKNNRRFLYVYQTQQTTTRFDPKNRISSEIDRADDDDDEEEVEIIESVDLERFLERQDSYLFSLF